MHIYGIHTIISTLQNKPHTIKKIIILKDRQDKKIDEIISIAKNHGIFVEMAKREYLDKLSEHGTHQGVVAQIIENKNYTENDLEDLLDNLSEPAFLLILDNITDPHNLGACLRTADAAGIHAVIAPKDKSASLTPLVRKIASGAAEVIPFIQVTNLARVLRFLKEKNIWIYGTSDDATKNYYEADFSPATAIVMGSEGEGMRRLTREHCDELLSIPMYGSVSSLNVSVATGICLFEVRRQRQ